MIRPFTFLCLAAACGSGLYLYTEKHRAELLDRQIAHVIHATEAARQTTSLLRAEWGLLNNPDRLRPMAEKYLGLTTMQPAQWVQLADLGTRLPPPVAAGAAGTTDDDSTADAPPAEPPAPQVVAVAPADPGIADPAPPKPIVPVHAAKPAAHPAPRKAVPPAMVADRDPPPARHNPFAHSMPLALATPQPARPHVLSAMARPVPLHAARPAVMSAVPSALGMREAVPPPVPLGAE